MCWSRLAAILQHCPSTLQSGLPTTGIRSRSIASAVLGFRYASPPTNTGDGGKNAQTIKLDHSLEAGQLSNLDELVYGSGAYVNVVRFGRE